MNTFFQKRLGRKWTWRSRNGDIKNKIDFVISDHKFNVIAVPFNK